MAPRWWPGRCATPAWRSIYTGLHQTPEQIVETAIQEDADAVGLSVLSGAHMTLFARVIDLLRGARTRSDITVFGGGIVPEADIPELEKLGVARIFTPGATTQEIVDWVRGPSRALSRRLGRAAERGRRSVFPCSLVERDGLGSGRPGPSDRGPGPEIAAGGTGAVSSDGTTGRSSTWPASRPGGDGDGQDGGVPGVRGVARRRAPDAAGDRARTGARSPAA